MGSTKSKYRAGQLIYYDSKTDEHILALYPAHYYDEFFGTLRITSAGGDWLAEDVSSAGSTAEAKVANQPGGVVHVALDATSEQQTAALYFNDVLEIDLDKGPIVEFRVALSTLPTGLAEVWFGVGNARVADYRLAASDQGPTIHAAFMFDGSGACTIHTDDGTTDNDAKSTGVTVVAAAFHLFRIDFTKVADVKFYIDGEAVVTGTTFDMSAGTDVVVQPFLVAYKASGTGEGDLYVDALKWWQKR